ncbi:MAG: hypothetical protein V2A79_10590 [Planctomycetota bacterium]
MPQLLPRAARVRARGPSRLTSRGHGPAAASSWQAACSWREELNTNCAPQAESCGNCNRGRFPQGSGERACPPEDAGSVDGYYGMLEALADPEHEEHESYIEWLDGGFDPEAFDLKKVNALLASIR